MWWGGWGWFCCGGFCGGCFGWLLGVVVVGGVGGGEAVGVWVFGVLFWGGVVVGVLGLLWGVCGLFLLIGVVLWCGSDAGLTGWESAVQMRDADCVVFPSHRVVQG
ncbi:hypothetical protein VSS95_28215, partial [Pseudomonas syringae pv. tagetis]